jgi:hypothetical protein
MDDKADQVFGKSAESSSGLPRKISEGLKIDEFAAAIAMAWGRYFAWACSTYCHPANSGSLWVAAVRASGCIEAHRP